VNLPGLQELTGGLGLRPPDLQAALRDGAIAIAGVILAVLLLDAVLFRHALSADYIAYYTGPMWPRTLAMCFKAVEEEVVYRLLLMTALVGLMGLVWRRKSAWIYWVAIILAQLALAWPEVLATPVWGALRFWAIGCVWGWLYWKNGWLAALGAHGLLHLFLDPLLMAALLATA
jgi:hypothetical protein